MVVIETNLPIGEKRRGKVRDIYDLGDYLLLVSTDRISAFDVVLPTPIPCKGMVLNLMSKFWFDFFSKDVSSHLISSYASQIVWQFPELREYEDVLRYRAMLVKKCKVLPVECIVRGYITGSGWKSYLNSGMVSGIKLPEGLRESERLEEPIFTPTTKVDVGHDEEISFDEVVEMIGKDLAVKIRNLSIKLYIKARDFAKTRGVIIADTKFEFGISENGDVCLIDEVLTPDSSRFWFADSYEVGYPQKSYDKQFVRDYLNSLNWDKTYPGPVLPDEVVVKTSERYRNIYRTIIGEVCPCDI